LTNKGLGVILQGLLIFKTHTVISCLLREEDDNKTRNADYTDSLC